METGYILSMSIEQSVDAHLIEQTKQQIRSLVAEIAQLAKTEVAPEEFYGQFLSRVVSALAAVGGAVWTLNPERQLALQYQINLQETQIRESETAQAQHGRLLYKALESSEGMLVLPHSGPGDLDGRGPLPMADDTPPSNPTDFLLVLGLLKTDLETVGLVEIFQRAEAGPSTQKGYLRFLVQMCELAGDYLKSHQLRHFSHRQTLWTQLEDFTRVVHASLDPREAAYTIANEGRRLIECDRVSVAILKGKKCRIEAISGQDVFDTRSNAVRLLGRLATAVVASGDAVWYTGDSRDLPPQVEDAVQEYVDEAHSKTVAVLPLQRPAPPEEDDRKKRVEPEGPIGALIVEQIEDSRVSGSLVQRTEVVCRHSSTALANALEHQNLFLMPVWRALGKTRWVLQARTLPKTLSIAGAVLAVFLLLYFWPARFTVESKGTLEPVVRRNVYADIDGVVEDLKVAHGDNVVKGQTLAMLRNIELDVALTGVEGERMTNLQRMSALQRSSEDRGLRSEQRLQLQGDLAEAHQKQSSLDTQLHLYQAKQLQLNIKSPIDGVVVTWDLRNRLIHRPVQKGQAMLRVADPSGPWHVELQMPENHMGFVAEAQQKLYEVARQRLGGLLREDVRAKLGEAASDEVVDTQVDAALAAVPNRDLHDRLLAEFNQRLRQQLQPIVAEVGDEAIRAKLSGVLGESAYDAAWARLQETLPEVEAADPTAYAKLRELVREESNDRLPVTFILATEPGTTHEGVVTEIHRSAELHGEDGNTVMIKVAIDKSELPQRLRRPGATVTAQVYCGQRSLGFVLFHDVIAFIQSRILFRYL